MTKIVSYIILVLVHFSVSFHLIAQDLKKQKREANASFREANTQYEKGNYADAEVAYKKALATYPGLAKANYNLANAIEKQNRHKEAITQYEYLAKNAKSPALKARSYHNMGNAFMQLKQYQKAVEAYKNALRINPKDEETRYNLALAQQKLKQQQKQNKKNKKNKKDRKNKDKKNKDKKNKDEKNKDEKNKDKKNKDEKNKDKKNKDEKNKDEKNKDEKNKDKGKDKRKQPQPTPGKISPQQAKQLLKALENEEKKTQKKVNAKRVKVKTKKQEKDW